MQDSSFPMLLNRKAKVLAGLNRTELSIMGVVYLLLSWIHVAGVVALLLDVAVLLIYKWMQRKLPRRFLQELGAPRILSWWNKLGGLNG
ncbi:MAG: hypothetical protein A2504_17045 [Bdellovibrionales bacterium RIFOXYD12_FULL_39_22]|nr:MAG: hypothetical protein A2385_17870 [Bdellovibrionales bacterium RIFOXYB1_FULL_39_21]OFZ44041.1 MAG: hypothetical protein A2485_15005 [Bdellovibrionales bacterium RIFOXYC12_FULL_39_17]OFZ48294.1 MAG: hypothetical protein A2404_08735 [Bdellovibrionales bacterium RIFOXYC1_FULL_39_130]OFZ76622.1 MAG: hypothetical protein A2560_17815 [Bdellovibrionales bacterium RIFOXYD1_FULL_39_84]OFZ95543.1 MAG: hypothetical protein A2504_17045 [Bdellovibrionales bacterium RIFOXYD12_FULL_39_22]